MKNGEVLIGMLNTGLWDAGSILASHATLLTPLLGEQITYIGVPGASEPGAACIIEMPVAVTKDTCSQESSMAFLNFLLDGIQEFSWQNKDELRVIPLERSILDAHVAMYQEHEETVTDVNGNTVTGIDVYKRQVRV